MYYMIMNDDETKFATFEGYMYPANSGGRLPFSTYVREKAEQWIENWTNIMINKGVKPYHLKIVERP